MPLPRAYIATAPGQPPAGSGPPVLRVIVAVTVAAIANAVLMWEGDAVQDRTLDTQMVARPESRQPAPMEPAIVVPSREVAVRVSRGGAPAADVEVGLVDGHARRSVARTGRDGVARFAAATVGPYETWAIDRDHVSPVVRFEDVPSSPTELALARGGSVTGTVAADRDAALPDGSTVTLYPLDIDHVARTVPLDGAGRFTLAGVPHGRWRVEAAVAGHVALSEPAIEVGETAREASIRVVRAASLEGTVVAADGLPVANATIVVRDQVTADAHRSITLALPDDDTSRWIHPLATRRVLPGGDSARFGAGRPGSRPAECDRGHCGVDLGSERGPIVHAIADGEVVAVVAENRAESGRYVAIHHGGGVKSMYMHLDDLRSGLEVGQRIYAGEPVGTVGSSGILRSVPHLHFALTHEHAGRTWYLDPEPMLRRAIVLPVARTLDAATTAATTDAATVATATRDRVPPAPRVHRITTDSAGRFRVGGLVPGTYVAAAFAAEHAPGTSDAFALRQGELASGVVVRMRTPSIVSGRVIGRDGPLAGAIVTVGAGIGETAHKLATTYTDRAGQFTLRAPSGKVFVTATASGHGTVERALVIGDRPLTGEVFALVVEASRLRGQVLAADGAALAGATIRVVEGPSRRRGVTVGDGRFELDHVAQGRYLVEVSAPGWPAKRFHLESERWQDLRLDAGGAIRAIVRDGSGGPLADARVELVGPAQARASAVTDARGAIDLRGLAAGEWTLTASTRGFTPIRRELVVRAGPTAAQMDLVLARGATLIGVVRDRFGRRVGGAVVSVQGIETRTDGDGNFRIDDAPVGDILLSATHDGARGDLPLRLESGAERLSLTIEIE